MKHQVGSIGTYTCRGGTIVHSILFQKLGG